MKQVAVVGGGPAGLAAAWTLAQAGIETRIYDRSARPGGLLRTDTLDGARVDVGVQLVSTTHTSLLALTQAAGGRELLGRSPGRDAMWRRGRAQSITYGSVASMATSGALPTSLKLKMVARYLPYLSAQAGGLDANDPASNGGAALDTESIGAWGRRELGADFIDYLVYPLLAAYYGALPDETSAPVYHALAKVGMDVTVYAAAGGFGALADAIVAGLEARGGRFMPASEVLSLARDEGGVRVETAAGSELYHAVVLAVPPNRAAAILNADGSLGTWLRSVQVRPVFTLALRTGAPHPGDYFGLSFPRGSDAGETVAALCVQSRKLKGLVPSGGDALVVLPAPAVVTRLLEQDDATIIDAMLGALEPTMPGLAAQVSQAVVYRFDDAYTLFEPGHLKRITAFDNALLPSRVALARA
ncbi:MAG: FAD-dependent oxidoreductase [Gemmatimonadota bacterium]